MFSWIKRIWNKITRVFNSFIKSVFTSSAKFIISELKDFAIQIVSNLEVEDLSNSNKRDVAFKEIKAEAIKKGLKIQSSLIYLIIEMALQFIKNQAK